MSAGCIGVSHPHCGICRIKNRCCLIETTKPPLAALDTITPETTALHDAVAAEALEATSLAQLLRVEISVQVNPSAPAPALPVGAPPASTIFTVVHEEEIEHVPASPQE